MNGFKDNSAASARQANIVVKTPYGELHIEDEMAAHDHLNMKADWLEAFLVKVSGEGYQSFATLSDRLQQSLLWEAQLAASEISQLLSQVRIVAKAGASK